MNIKVLLITIIIICIFLIYGLYTYRNKINQKESFSSPCTTCDSSVWDIGGLYSKDNVSGEDLNCNIRECYNKETFRNDWDSSKLNTMKEEHFQVFTQILKTADFKINEPEQYDIKLKSYIGTSKSYPESELEKNYKMITKINKSGWGNNNSVYKTEYNQRWAGVEKGWKILNDLIDAYNVIKEYSQSDISVIKRLNYDTQFKPYLTLFTNYKTKPSEYSDLNSSVGGNNYSSGGNFWNAITNTYFCLKYLSSLISSYKNNQLFELDSLRSKLLEYKTYFDGSKIGDFNVDTGVYLEKGIYHHYKQQIKEYAGDTYLSDGRVDSTDPLMPQNVRINAYNNYDYETLSNCNNLYNDTVDNWSSGLNRQNEMTTLKQNLETSLYVNDINKQAEAIQNTKNTLWDNNNDRWDPIKNGPSTYSSCQPGDNSNSGSNFNFMDYSNDVELQRKKVQYARRDLISSLFGEDVQSYRISEKLPTCPSIVNQENTNIQGWIRANNTDQDEKCKEKDYFRDESLFYSIGKNEIFKTRMKPGYIVNGVDNWISNYEDIKSKSQQLQDVTGNNSNYDDRDSVHTDLIRKAGHLQEVILKDRDWNGSKYKWDQKKKERDSGNLDYIVENYLKAYNKKISLNEPSKYQFNINYKVSGQEFNEVVSNSLFFYNNDHSNTIEQINITSSNLDSGIIRLYRNMYQYSDYLTETKTSISLPNINNLTNFSFLSIIYSKLEWDLDDMVEYGYDLNIICSTSLNNNINLYSLNNFFMIYDSTSKFGKLFYSSKNQNSNLNSFSWTILKEPNSNNYMLMNKEYQVFLALGSNYNPGEQFQLNTGIPELNNKIGKGSKLVKEKSFYFVSKSSLETLKNSSVLSDQYMYSNILQDCNWIIEEHKNNKYTIKSVYGDLLYFSSAVSNISIVESSDNSSKKRNYGTISFASMRNNNSEEEESSNYYFCDSNEKVDCYNKYFYIVPAPPKDISSELKTLNFNNNQESTIFEKCLSQEEGTKLDHTQWFRQYDDLNRHSYMDKKEPQNNQYSDIYSLFRENESYKTGVFSLDGGEGENCASSNFCHLSKELSPNESGDGQVNSIKQDNTVSNIQTQSHDVDISFRNKEKLTSATYKVPLYKYNFKCSRNDINVYKIYDNETKITFDSTINPNILTVNEVLSGAPSVSNRKIIISIYSIDNTYKEGRDFGMSSLGTFFWFRNTVDTTMTSEDSEPIVQRQTVRGGSESVKSTPTPSGPIYIDPKKLRIVYGFYNQVLQKYLILNNSDISSLQKRQRKKIITWDDKIKFMNSGYKDFDKTKNYTYSYSESS